MPKGKKGKKRKKPNVIPESGESLTLPDILSSDAVIRAISSRVQQVVISGSIRTSAVVNFDLVDSATGKVIKSVSSLSDEVLSAPGLPADALHFLQTPLGRDILKYLIFVLVLFYREHATDVRLDQLEQFIRQTLQSQPFLSHSEPATPTPKKPSQSPSKEKAQASRKNQKSQPNRRTSKKKE